MKHPMTERTRTMIAALAVVAGLAGVASAEDASESEPEHRIVVEISNLESDVGQVRCSIFSKEDGFPGEVEKADKKTWVKPKSKKATCTFDGIKPGTYAVAAIHDLDGNGELNKSIVGRPKEPWAVSNNAPAQRFGPPLFKDAKFKFDGGKKVLKLKLQKS
jgi:uncharacterized protein (DUF2141 family)